ncbi:hypothetical protein BVE84_06315 [Streptococcus azizii]|uniref:LXG domain-containing protein n=1 Tax=Streptococcus azizii TaxID=1579424 RepID=A0AB36JQB7_9STRE|nr:MULTISPECIES: hypothetical protein [Streptococcus]MBF0776871.1 hypothetical protein [Streptococcus sp. 19428wD3_AN2]ONK27057.1 hypothetical protein BVE86_05680 [Streptococcus azizii]ONK28410.1 hypothetical protein BVE85_04540 [Streptococcus azizii]ONK28490.1 hypothetical protein BVE84_06315 [Streptococcus azizii]TFU82227.1 hypothetical protein E4T83_08970 [Streptococcus sp. AN2]
MTLMTNYYSQENYEGELAEIIRSLQKQAAQVQAGLLQKSQQKIQQEFDTDGKKSTLTTQIAMKNIYEQIDTAIKGKAGQALKETLERTLPQYDKVFPG